MKAIIRYFPEDLIPEPFRLLTFLPILDLSIHGAPHKRQHRAVLQRYRNDLFQLANRRLDIDLPIDHPIALKVLFTNPNSPDLDHLLEALYMALDGKALEGPSILTDDRHIQEIIKLGKYYPDTPTKRDGMR